MFAGALPRFPGVDAVAMFLDPPDGSSDPAPSSLNGYVALAHRTGRVHPAVAAYRAQAAGAVAVVFLSELEDVATLTFDSTEVSHYFSRLTRV